MYNIFSVGLKFEKMSLIDKSIQKKKKKKSEKLKMSFSTVNMLLKKTNVYFVLDY